MNNTINSEDVRSENLEELKLTLVNYSNKTSDRFSFDKNSGYEYEYCPDPNTCNVHGGCVFGCEKGIKQ